MRNHAALKNQQAAGEVLRALKRLSRACDSAKYDPSQPRVPSGHSSGGQWTDGGGGSGSSSEGSGSGTARNTGDSTTPAARPPASGSGSRNPTNFLDIVENIVSAIPQGRWLRIAQTLRAGGRLAGPLAKLSFGGHKSAKKWANQLRDRKWTLEEIDETISKGKKFPAPNMVNPGNKATRYENERTGKYIVRDDKTGDILQIGDKDFMRRDK